MESHEINILPVHNYLLILVNIPVTKNSIPTYHHAFINLLSTYFMLRKRNRFYVTVQLCLLLQVIKQFSFSNQPKVFPILKPHGWYFKKIP
jgi:hypothetical protein